MVFGFSNSSKVGWYLINIYSRWYRDVASKTAEENSGLFPNPNAPVGRHQQGHGGSKTLLQQDRFAS